ncbi:MAG: DUF1330 domain-containing protein [Rhodospirillaceae bacterium]
MTVYVIGQARVTDPAGFKKYSETVAGLAEQFGGKLIGAGGPDEKTLIEGAQFENGRVVIFEYPSLEAYQKYVASEKYQEAKGYRMGCGTLDVCVIPAVG